MIPESLHKKVQEIQEEWELPNEYMNGLKDHLRREKERWQTEPDTGISGIRGVFQRLKIPQKDRTEPERIYGFD